MTVPSALRLAVVAALVGGAATALPAEARAEALTATLVAETATSAWGRPSPDPAGITYLPGSRRLLISDSEVDEMPLYAGTNLFLATLDGVQDPYDLGGTTVPWSHEPAGVGYSDRTGTLYVSDDDLDRVFQVRPGADGKFGTADDAVTSFSTRAVQNGDAEEVAVDMDVTANGHLLTIDGHNRAVYDFGPGPNGTFDGLPPAGDDTVTSFDVSRYGARDPEGIEYHPRRNTLLVLDSSSRKVYEVSRDGALLNTIDISAGRPKSAAGITLAPASDGADRDDLYIVDRGVDNNTNPAENDGRLYEMAVDLPPLRDNFPPSVFAGPDRTGALGTPVALAGAVSDDGRPAATVTAGWSVVSGPAPVTFADPTAPATAATFGATGTYVLRLGATDTDLSSSDDVTVTMVDPPPPGLLDVPVSVGSDDAEERSGSVSLTGTDLELTTDGTTVQRVGLRFPGMALPRGATVTNAYVQFSVDEATSVATNLTIAGQAADNAPPFAVTSKDVSSRPRTTATVGWAPPAWPTVGARTADQRTPNLAAVLQEIVARPGWAGGNAVVLVITGTGTRTASASERGSAKTPVLHVEFTSRADTAPTVSAGADLAVTLPAGAALAGTVSDDGSPTGSTVSVAWSVVDGPGTVTFDDPEAEVTTASFSAAGVYVLRLTATDGEISAYDDVIVTVGEAPPNGPPVVDAGPDAAVTLPAAAALAGSVSDDGLPDPPALVTATWSTVGGPGAVTFADPSAPATTATFGAPGTYVLRLTATDGDLEAGDEVTLTVEPPRSGVLAVPVAVGSDDAEERSASVSLTGTDLELTTDGTTVQKVGLRFAGVALPPGATITSASVQFSVDEASTAATALTIAGQAADDPPTFTAAGKDVSSRPRTAATVAWSPAPWPTAGARGADQRTPELAPVLQEVVNRPGWASGNAVVLVVTGTGTRTAAASERGPAKVPVLHVEWTL